MTEIVESVRETAAGLVGKRVGVAVAGVVGDRAEIAAAGTAEPGTVFEIGSVTKVFTSLVLARMVVAGGVRLDEPVSAVLGAPVPGRDGVTITLRHLATHTSGLPRLPTGMLGRALLRPHTPDPYRDCTADFLLDGLARTKLGAVPGKRFKYSNLGAGLLGLALSRRAGLTYGELLDREVVRPLGLTRTGLDVPGLTQGHDKRRRPVPPWNLADLAGAGGLRSTVADLVTFARAQLDPASTELEEAILLTRSEAHRVSPVMNLHLGWVGLHRGGNSQLWHNGATGGFSSFFAFSPDRGAAVIALSDTQRPVDRPATALLRALEKAHPPVK